MRARPFVHNLGVIEQTEGRTDLALGCHRAAIDTDPARYNRRSCEPRRVRRRPDPSLAPRVGQPVAPPLSAAPTP